VNYFVDNYGHFAVGATIGIVICIILLASIIIGCCVKLEKPQNWEDNSINNRLIWVYGR